MSDETNGPTFTTEQREALRCVLDEIIPRSEDGRMPGAGEIGLVDHVERALRKTPDLLSVIAAGLAAADRGAGDLGAAGFASLPVEQRASVLEQLSAAQPGFLPSLIFHTYVGYYQDSRVVGELGIETHPPFPKGFDLEPGDPSLLDTVKQRPVMYREV